MTNWRLDEYCRVYINICRLFCTDSGTVDPLQIADDHAGEDYSVPGTSAAVTFMYDIGPWCEIWLTTQIYEALQYSCEEIKHYVRLSVSCHLLKLDSVLDSCHSLVRTHRPCGPLCPLIYLFNARWTASGSAQLHQSAVSSDHLLAGLPWGRPSSIIPSTVVFAMSQLPAL